MKLHLANSLMQSLFGIVIVTLLPVAAWAIPVQSDTTLRLWIQPQQLDALSLSDGTSFGTWNGNSAVTNNMTAPSGGQQPKFYSNQFNGQSVARFDGADDLLLGTVSHDAMTIYYVAKFTNSGIPWASSKDNVTYLGRPGGTTHYLYDGVASSPNYTASNPGTAEIFGGTYSTAANQATIWVNGVVKSTGTNGSTTHIGTDRVGNRTTNDGPFAGDLAEVLVYSSPLSQTRSILLENFLSAKYDVALGAHNFYDGDNVAKGNFDSDVFGIGSTAGSPVLSDSSAGLTISAVNNTINDNEWVLAGHAIGPNGVTPAVPFGSQRWERSWYIDATTVTSANLAFDWNDAGNTAPFDAAFNGLYYRQNNSGPFSLIATGTVDVGNQAVSFANVTFPTDGYFTLGSIPVPEPSTLSLFGLGILGLAAKARRNRSLA